MKYVRLFFWLIPFVAFTGGCAFNADRDGWNYDGSGTVDLVVTEHFLPLQERGEAGEVLPYEAAPNPYTALKGRIDKEAVTAYIDARRAFNAKKFEFAEQLLAELVEQEADLSGPWVMRGDIAVEQGELAQAVEHYVAALDINPINFNAWLRLANTQRMRGHFHHAQNTYAKALTHWADGPELHLNLGVLYDLYLNMPLKAQAHMEAYQLLSDGGNQEVVAWLEEIRQRTGVAKALKIVGPDGELEALAKQPAAQQSPSRRADAVEHQHQALAASESIEE